MDEMTGRIARIGRPVRAPEDGDERDGDDDYEEHVWVERDSQHMFAQFFQRTPEQYVESLERARAITTARWGFEEPQSSAEIEGFETQVADLATAFRTLPFREVLLYMELLDQSAPLPPLSDPVGELSREQLAALFFELERRGAFAEEDDEPAVYAGRPSLEKWRMHREMEGEFFDLDVGGWCAIYERR